MKRIIHDNKQRVGHWVAQAVGRDSDWGSFESIGLEEDGILIAGMVVESYVKNARCCVHLAGTGKRWLNREYLKFCCKYMFDQLNCKVVVGLVDADNEAALSFDKHFGFKELTRIPDGAGDCDLVVLTLTREDCRWLKLKVR